MGKRNVIRGYCKEIHSCLVRHLSLVFSFNQFLFLIHEIFFLVPITSHSYNLSEADAIIKTYFESLVVFN